jgi:hypothetical protein
MAGRWRSNPPEHAPRKPTVLPMTGEAVLWLFAIFYFTIIALILLELQRVLRRIYSAIEQNAALLKTTNEKLDGLAALNEKVATVGETVFDLSERFDAPGLAKERANKRTEGIAAMLHSLATKFPRNSS